MKQRHLLWWNKVFIPGVTQALFFISFNFLLENIKICIMKIGIESTSLLSKTLSQISKLNLIINLFIVCLLIFLVVGI